MEEKKNILGYLEITIYLTANIICVLILPPTFLKSIHLARISCKEVIQLHNRTSLLIIYLNTFTILQKM